MSQRRIKERTFASYIHPVFRIVVVQRSHYLQMFGNDYQDHPNVFGEGEKELSEIFGFNGCVFLV
ncbi:hypothetical protein SDC9_160730 [bioreactor metagenome]|uniref:Uncharacterized protein n=1 Tax=bioreactor metagenome TaxID=1076179 RepID=A0A645FJ90_9ZZZZ